MYTENNKEVNIAAIKDEGGIQTFSSKGGGVASRDTVTWGQENICGEPKIKDIATGDFDKDDKEEIAVVCYKGDDRTAINVYDIVNDFYVEGKDEPHRTEHTLRFFVNGKAIAADTYQTEKGERDQLVVLLDDGTIHRYNLSSKFYESFTFQGESPSEETITIKVDIDKLVDISVGDFNADKHQEYALLTSDCNVYIYSTTGAKLKEIKNIFGGGACRAIDEGDFIL
jgi:hypothetical protein